MEELWTSEKEDMEKRGTKTKVSLSIDWKPYGPYIKPNTKKYRTPEMETNPNAMTLTKAGASIPVSVSVARL
jgi:hypothetical protein